MTNKALPIRPKLDNAIGAWISSFFGVDQLGRMIYTKTPDELGVKDTRRFCTRATAHPENFHSLVADLHVDQHYANDFRGHSKERYGW